MKYENVYLSDYDTPRAAQQGLAQYLEFYNKERPHQALGYRTPAEVYFNPVAVPLVERARTEISSELPVVGQGAACG